MNLSVKHAKIQHFSNIVTFGCLKFQKSNARAHPKDFFKKHGENVKIQKSNTAKNDKFYLKNWQFLAQKRTKNWQF